MKSSADIGTSLLSPFALAVMTFMAGPHISLFPAMRVLRQTKKSFLMTHCLLIFAAVAFLCLYAILLLWPIEWFWVSLLLLAMQVSISIIYYLFFRNIQKRYSNAYVLCSSSVPVQNKRYILAGTVGGAVLIPILGAPFAILFLLGSDKLLSTLMPLVFDDITSIILLVLSSAGLFLSGLIAGGWAGSIPMKSSPSQTLFHSLSLVWTSLNWFFFLILTLVLPGFLASQANSHSFGQSFTTFFIGIVFIGSWWSVFLLYYSLCAPTIGQQFLRLAGTPFICLSSAFLLSVVCGYPGYWFHSAGKYFEKTANITNALWSYEQGLLRNPSDIHASYLQYRIALLSHKRGDDKKASDGFGRIVAQYTDDKLLVNAAHQFLDNLERNGKRGQRVVLPGVEHPTAYKGAYCVPNSLALVMNFWGADIDAHTIGQEITGLASGTLTVDQSWFAESRGFKHQFMPMAELSDIKTAIDEGFPVMVYVPQHVLVIVGYDERLETFVTYDVATRDVWVEYLQKDFLKSWKKEHATMIVAYPKVQEHNIPPQLLTSLAERSDAFFHYHLHYLRPSGEHTSLYHLKYAAERSPSYFFPLMAMYEEFPSMRMTVHETFDIPSSTQVLVDYFSRDFDEGLHLAGQMHYDDQPWNDTDLKAALTFLIGTGQKKRARDLIEKIKESGLIADNTEETLAIVNLSLGEFDIALPQLEEYGDSQMYFYLAQGYLSMGNPRGAVSGLIETVDDCT
jgi:hypothetical protein